MKLISSFLKLIRWPNLLFIAVTQLLFNFGVVHPIFQQAHLATHLSNQNLILLMLASVCIAAAGYIINDYFDVNIDQINKPQRVLVDKIINRRWAIFWHMFLSMVGVVISFIVSFLVSDGYYLIGFVNFACVLVLWVYSTTYKRKILIGNVVVSVLTAWSILLIYAAEFPGVWTVPEAYAQQYILANTKLFRTAFLYAGFAFILSLIREVIKDLEDMDGDRKEGCRTMPICWGVPASKMFASVWIVVLMLLLLVTQAYALQLGWWLFAAYLLVAVLLPLGFILKWLYAASLVSHYTSISRWLKVVMLTGILSMCFFKYYFQ